MVVTSTLCLGLIDFADEYNELFLYTDISKIGLSGTLIVRNIDEHWPVTFHSQKFGSVEVNCSTAEYELLAIVDSLKYFRQYLFGQLFTIYMDH